MEDIVLSDYRNAIVSYVKHFTYGRSVSETAEDVGQKMVVEAMEQPKTWAYLLRHTDQIHRHRLPGLLRRRATHLAWALSDSGKLQSSSGDVALVEDKKFLSDERRLEAKMIADELAEKEPRVVRLLDAYAAGCTTRKEVAAHLGIAERTLYDWFDELRRRWAS